MTSESPTDGGGDQLDSTDLTTVPPSAEGARSSARPHGPALWIPFGALAAAIVVVDQLTKAWIVANIAPGEAIELVGDSLRLVHSRNTGALFGLFRDGAPIFAVASVVVVAMILWYHGRSGRSPYLTLTLGLLLGGAIGNLIDRFRFGYVVDFVDAGIGSLRWYTFNVADAAISCALVLLVLLALRPSLAGTGPPTDERG